MLSSNPVASRPSRREHPTPGERVRAARTRENLTQQELAVRAKKHINTIANLEDDSMGPRVTARGWQTVVAVAKALGTTPEELGYRRKHRVRARELTAEQRDVVEDILSLPKDELTAIREILRQFEARRRKGTR
ncbi:MAG TPA: helix-turn-helix transcriptional regulator [Thermoanaerobaculia bacterium]|nr:helix-turn-helix transcriptional regulator [Thermoanaerobaculia bacterium]